MHRKAFEEVTENWSMYKEPESDYFSFYSERGDLNLEEACRVIINDLD